MVCFFLAGWGSVDLLARWMGLGMDIGGSFGVVGGMGRCGVDSQNGRELSHFFGLRISI